MICETLEQNNGNQKSMVAKFIKRNKKARTTQRARANKVYNKKLNKLKRQIKSRLGRDWEKQKALFDKMAKL